MRKTMMEALHDYGGATAIMLAGLATLYVMM
ncbi:hypothetical protein FHW37_111158 [Neorhizobium alkalisoli]|jgi:hypothetical protein|uniref:Uncharacterized protein n=1 Tax=Neorhizobium alkalisoli TaxID=528178 RepID=A0A561QBB8_9HYPH|nr:hypothetical protein FHW37_111158 [Neorhizobium alkalisoli]